jgi:hypothetical protein
VKTHEYSNGLETQPLLQAKSHLKKPKALTCFTNGAAMSATADSFYDGLSEALPIICEA